MGKLKIGTRKSNRPIVKGVRLTKAEARALTQYSEQEECDEATIWRYALGLLPGWRGRVKRAEQYFESGGA
jgi:hypothetical protein